MATEQDELAQAKKDLVKQRMVSQLAARGYSLAEADEVVADIEHRIDVTSGNPKLIDGDGVQWSKGLETYVEHVIEERGGAPAAKAKSGQPSFEARRQEATRGSSEDPDEIARHMARVSYGI